VRGSMETPRPGNHELFAFLTCNPNGVVEPIHPKTMPVILTHKEEIEITDQSIRRSEYALDGDKPFAKPLKEPLLRSTKISPYLSVMRVFGKRMKAHEETLRTKRAGRKANRTDPTRRRNVTPGIKACAQNGTFKIHGHSAVSLRRTLKCF
jgi:hypothetical protein